MKKRIGEKSGHRTFLFLFYSFLLGSYVNDQVEVLIVVPLLEILMSTPPESNISKVSELELLTILARHDCLRKGTVLNIPLTVATVKRNVK